MRIRRLRTTMRLLGPECNGMRHALLGYGDPTDAALKCAQNKLFLLMVDAQASSPIMIGIDIEAVEIVRIARGSPALESCIGAPLVSPWLPALPRSDFLLSALS